MLRLLRLTRAAPVQISLPKCSWQDSAEKCHKQYLMSLLLFAVEPCRIAHRYPQTPENSLCCQTMPSTASGSGLAFCRFCPFDDTARRVQGLSKEAARRFPRGCKDILASKKRTNLRGRRAFGLARPLVGQKDAARRLQIGCRDSPRRLRGRSNEDASTSVIQE